MWSEMQASARPVKTTVLIKIESDLYCVCVCVCARVCEYVCECDWWVINAAEIRPV